MYPKIMKMKNKEERFKNTNFQGIIKGLSITTLVLSSITILLCIASIVYLIIAYIQSNSTNLVNDIANNSNYGNRAYLQDDKLHIGNSVSQINEMTNNGLTYLMIFTIFIILCSGFSLFVSIFTFIKVNKHKKSKNLVMLNFLNIFCSVLSFSPSRIIITIINYIFIIQANKLNKLFSKPKKFGGKHGSEEEKIKVELNINKGKSFDKLVTKARHVKK